MMSGGGMRECRNAGMRECAMEGVGFRVGLVRWELAGTRLRRAHGSSHICRTLL